MVIGVSLHRSYGSSLFHARVQCRFHAGAGRVQAGTMRVRVGAGWQYDSAGCGAGYLHLVRGGCGSTAMAAGRVRV